MQLLILFFSLTLLCAFRFNPMSQSIDLGSGTKSAQFIAENETTESMAIVFSVKERAMDLEGKETHPDTKNLTIIPPQVIIPPKEKRTIRVNWNGPSDIQTEEAFRVIAEQVPVNVDKTKRQSGIQMLMRYMAALYVTPVNVEPKLEARILSSATDGFVLSVKNSGRRHQVLQKPSLIIKRGGDKWVLKENDLKGLAGENVLAGSERHFSVKTNRPCPPDSEVTLKVEE